MDRGGLEAAERGLPHGPNPLCNSKLLYSNLMLFQSLQIWDHGSLIKIYLLKDFLGVELPGVAERTRQKCVGRHGGWTLTLLQENSPPTPSRPTTPPGVNAHLTPSAVRPRLTVLPQVDSRNPSVVESSST